MFGTSAVSLSTCYHLTVQDVTEKWKTFRSFASFVDCFGYYKNRSMPVIQGRETTRLIFRFSEQTMGSEAKYLLLDTLSVL